MNKEQAEKRIEKLKKEISYYRYLYHVLDKIEISDAALDSLKNELDKLEKKFPDLITADSTTQRVGGKPLDKFRKVRHSAPMMSLFDAFSRDDMIDWEKRMEKNLTPRPPLSTSPLTPLLNRRGGPMRGGDELPSYLGGAGGGIDRRKGERGRGEKDFFRLVKIGFSAKRKMLKNNLANGYYIGQQEAENRLEKAGFSAKVRAQELSVADWVKLFEKFK